METNDEVGRVQNWSVNSIYSAMSRYSEWKKVCSVPHKFFGGVVNRSSLKRFGRKRHVGVRRLHKVRDLSCGRVGWDNLALL
jgi:hypothetical protein